MTYIIKGNHDNSSTKISYNLNSPSPIVLDQKTKENIQLLLSDYRIYNTVKYNDGYLLYGWNNLGDITAYLDDSLYIKKAEFPNYTNFYIRGGNDVAINPAFSSNITFIKPTEDKVKINATVIFGHNIETKELTQDDNVGEEVKSLIINEMIKYEDWFDEDINLLQERMFEILDPAIKKTHRKMFAELLCNKLFKEAEKIEPIFPVGTLTEDNSPKRIR